MEKERRRAVLTPRNRLVDSVLAGHSFDEADINDATRWGNQVQAAVQRWQVGRPNVLARPRLTKPDAQRLLRFELAALAAGGAE